MMDKNKTTEKNLGEITTKDDGLQQAPEVKSGRYIDATSKPNVDDPKNYIDSKIKPGSLLSTKNKIDTAYKVSSNQLEEIDADKSVLVLSALKNTSTNEEAIMFLHEQSKYLIVLTEEDLNKNFTIGKQ